jgi:hypothetical protein
VKIAVAGAGIYGSSIAIRLAERGHRVHLFDPLGVMAAASGINQNRVHSGYHYPRSEETILELLEARDEFLATFQSANVADSRHYYAIPKRDSKITPDRYEEVMTTHRLPLCRCSPEWMNFDYVERCYEVDEKIYDPDLLRSFVECRIVDLGIQFCRSYFVPSMKREYDFVVWATYGLGESRERFGATKLSIAEKTLIKLPSRLQHVALVLVDGAFTAFDPYGSSDFSLFGSAKFTNHWSTIDLDQPIPEMYRPYLNGSEFNRVPFTRFEEMRADCSLAVPDAARAEYIGSKFTLRVVENSPQDRRIVKLAEISPRELCVFSGKVVSAVKAARLVCERVSALE